MIKGRTVWKVIFFWGGGEGGRGGVVVGKNKWIKLQGKMSRKLNPKGAGVASAWTKEEKTNLEID